MKTSIKNFFLAFMISAVVFFSIALFVLYLLGGFPSKLDNNNSEVTDEYDETDAPDSNAGDGSKALDFSMLFVGLDYTPTLFYDYYNPSKLVADGLSGYEGDREAGSAVTDGEYREISADAILLVGVSHKAKEFVFTPIEPNTLIDSSILPELYGNTTVCLGDIYYQYGHEAFLGSVEKLIGIKIDRHAYMNLDEFPKIIDTIDGVDFNVPCDMKYDDNKGQLHINIEAGMQTLDGEKALQVLRFNKYEGTDNSRLDTTISLAKALMDKISSVTFITRADAIFEIVENMISTNFSAGDLMAQKKTILSYNNPESNYESVTVELVGNYSTINDRLCFIPDKNRCLNAFFDYASKDDR